jgi:hypothetical protein
MFGNSWTEVAEVIAGRNNEQCRDRWSDKINPTIARGKWTDDEDKSLLEAVASLGTSNWKNVSQRLGNGRTDHNCRSRYDRLVRPKQKKKVPKPKPSTAIPSTSISPTNEPQNADNVQLKTQIHDAGPSSGPARRPRHRAKKAPPAELGVMGQDEQQSIDRPRPKPKPRARKGKETAEQHDIVESEPTLEATGGDEKEKGKQKATSAPSGSVRKRKRKGPTGDDPGNNPPPKRKKYGSKSQPETTATEQGFPVDETSCSTPEGLAASDQPEGVRVLCEGEEDNSTQAKVPTKGAHTKPTVEPTRRQPLRASSRKSIS